WCPRLLLGDTAGASRRATCASFRALPRFALLERITQASAHAEAHVICGVFRLRAPLQFCPCAGPSFARRSEPREGGRRKNEPLSQLLAGPLSGSGGSSGAARVLNAACMNPRAPHPVPLSQRLARTPLSGRGGVSLTERCAAGIRRGSLCG